MEVRPSSAMNTAKHPHFLIIGAPKSGTTWLVQTLRANSVYLPPNEIHYFSRLFTRKDWTWYIHHFADARPSDVIGENSNTYLTDRDAAGRIRSRLPNAKIVAVLRNPIERAYSGYCMQLARGKVGNDVEKYLDPQNLQTSLIVEYGKYHAMLQRYVDAFPAEQLFIAIYDDLLENAREELVRLATFLGAPQRELVKPLSTRINARKTVSIAYPLRRFLWPMVCREAVRRPLVKLLRGVPLWQRAESALSGPVAYPPLPKRTRCRLAEYYADDVRQLSRMLGRDLSCWLNPPVSQIRGNGVAALSLAPYDKARGRGPGQ